MATLLVRRYAVALGTGPAEASPTKVLEPWYRTHDAAQTAAERLNQAAKAGLIEGKVPDGATFYVRPDRVGIDVPDNATTEEILLAAAKENVNVEIFIRLQGVAGGSYVGAVQASEIMKLMREKP